MLCRTVLKFDMLVHYGTITYQISIKSDNLRLMVEQLFPSRFLGDGQYCKGKFSELDAPMYIKFR